MSDSYNNLVYLCRPKQFDRDSTDLGNEAAGGDSIDGSSSDDSNSSNDDGDLFVNTNRPQQHAYAPDDSSTDDCDEEYSPQLTDKT